MQSALHLKHMVNTDQSSYRNQLGLSLQATTLGRLQSHWDKIAVIELDMDDDRALRILLADNRTSDLADYDSFALAEILSEFARGYDMEGLVWNQDDLDDMLATQSHSIANMAVSGITSIDTEGAHNPMESESNHVTNDTKVAQFYLTSAEFDTLRDALQATAITNRNDALMKVVTEWLAQRNI